MVLTVGVAGCRDRLPTRHAATVTLFQLPWVKIVTLEEVPVYTMGFGSVDGGECIRVVFGQHGTEVSGIDASAVAALVVNFVAPRNRAD